MIVTDLIKQQTLTLTSKGYRCRRPFLIDDILGAADAKLYNATLDAAIPSIGDVHPAIPNIFANNIEAKPKTTGEQIIITVIYEPPEDAGSGSGNATTNASSSTASEETNLDINGDAMVTQYNTIGSLVDGVRFTAEVERPRTTFVSTFTQLTFPKTTIDTYTGKTNSVIWNGYAVNTILCTAVDSKQQDSDYEVRMSFAYNEDTWTFLAKTPNYPPLIAHPTNPDAGLDLTTGTRPYEVYEQVDFTPLGIVL